METVPISFAYPVCPLRAKPDGHPVPSIPGDDKTKVGHLRFLGDVGISPQLPRSDPTVAGRSFCDEAEVSPVPRYVISCSILLSYHLSPLPQLDTLLVRPTANLDSDRLGASHPARPTWHRAEQKPLLQIVTKVSSHLTITANVSVLLIFPRARTYSQLPWKSNIFWSKLL